MPALPVDPKLAVMATDAVNLAADAVNLAATTDHHAEVVSEYNPAADIDKKVADKGVASATPVDLISNDASDLKANRLNAVRSNENIDSAALNVDNAADLGVISNEVSHPEAVSKLTTVPPTETTAPSAAPVDYQAMQIFCYEVESVLSTINLADDYYAVLGISSQVSLPEIQQAYKNLYEKFNPQNHRELIRLVPQLGTQLATIIQQLESAHKVLSNIETRNAYNSQLRRKTTRVVESGESSGSKLGTVSGKFRPVTMKNVVATPNPAMESTGKRPAAKATPSTSVGKSSGVYIDPSRMRNADDWYLFGLEMLESNDGERAVKAFQQAVRLKPRDAEFHAALARSYEKIHGYNERTIEEYQAAIELKPKVADYYAELALFYTKHKYWAEAKQYNEQALQIDVHNRAALRVKQMLEKESPQ
jgi:tetratricopeptide (TPR) repeat protein